MIEPATIRKQLHAMRAKHGSDTAIGHRVSNLLEQMKNHATATGERKAVLAKSIADTVSELAAVSAYYGEAD